MESKIYTIYTELATSECSAISATAPNYIFSISGTVSKLKDAISEALPAASKRLQVGKK